VSSTLYSSDQEVTINAAKAGYVGNSATGNTSTNPSCEACP
jgi:hypothetical protein